MARGATEKASRGKAVGYAAFMLVICYGLGVLFLSSAVWFTDPSMWWLVAITLLVTGLMYYQARNNLL